MRHSDRVETADECSTHIRPAKVPDNNAPYVSSRVGRLDNSPNALRVLSGMVIAGAAMRMLAQYGKEPLACL